jgi:PAS domain S-box-containing protein
MPHPLLYIKQFLNNISIKNKLILIIVFTCSAVVITGLSLFTYYDIRTFRDELESNMQINAHLISQYCVSSLEFKHQDEAIRVLENLKANPFIFDAFIYEKDSTVFAEFHKYDNDIMAPPPIHENQVGFWGDFIHAFYSIDFENKQYGTLYLRGSTQELEEKVLKHLLFMLLLTAVLLIIAYFIARLLQLTISKPILKLAKVTKKISEDQDYSIRMHKKGTDEIGILFDGFNIMLDQIQIKQNELHKLQNYFSNIIDSMPSILVGVDTDCVITQWNKEAVDKSGIKKKVAIGQHLSEAIPRLASETNRIKLAMESREILINHKQQYKVNHSTYFEDVTIYPLIGNDIQGAVIRIDDVTDRVHMEDMMIQSEKMLSVGGLAAGMAHEINNPLAGLMQTAKVLNSRLVDNLNIKANIASAEAVGTSLTVINKYMEAREVPRMLNTINDSGKRVAAIVNNMLSFARNTGDYISKSDIEILLDKTIELAATDYDLKKHYDFKTIKLIREYEKNLPAVPCEATMIQQVLLNILRNGAEAMQDAGIKDPTFIIRTSIKKKKNLILIEIIDNGPGMDRKTRKQVFEPFFTTKPVGVGTGLGLSVSYFIITKNHCGELTVSSSPGKGANFSIRLPILRENS